MTNTNDDLIAKAKPTATAAADNSGNPRHRFTGYGEQFVSSLIPTKHSLADEGSYFVSYNPTLGTALALGIQTTFSDTLAAFVIQNPASAGGPSLYMDYIKMLVTVAPASAVNWQYALKLEPSSLRAPTGGNAAMSTPANVNGGSAVKSVATLQSGTGTAYATVPASTAASRIVGRGNLRGVIAVIGDELMIGFGAVDPAGAAGAPSTGSRQGSNVGPVIIPPGGSLSAHFWLTSNAATGPSVEAEIAWWER